MVYLVRAEYFPIQSPFDSSEDFLDIFPAFLLASLEGMHVLYYVVLSWRHLKKAHNYTNLPDIGANLQLCRTVGRI